MSTMRTVGWVNGLPVAELDQDTLDFLAGLAESDEHRWQDEAACAEVDGELWFPEKGRSARDAKRICRSCPVLDECRADVLARDEPYGIWAGMTAKERQRLKPYAGPPAGVHLRRAEAVA